jgi:putative hydrolase of the HAD superfamily
VTRAYPPDPPEQGPSPRYEAVIWDIDDALVDSRECHMRAQRAALAALRVPEELLTRAMAIWERLFWFFEQGDHEGILRALAHELNLGVIDQEQLRRAAAIAEAAWETEMRPQRGVQDCLQRLTDGGLKLGVVSTGDPGVQHAKLERVRLNGYFADEAILLEARGSPRAKPNPYLIRQCCLILGVEPARSAYVGDRTSDVIAANLAGVEAVLIPSGPFEYKQPTDVGALIIERPSVTLQSAVELVRHLAL